MVRDHSRTPGLYGPYRENSHKWRVVVIVDGGRASAVFPTEQQARDAIAYLRPDVEAAARRKLADIRTGQLRRLAKPCDSK